MPLEKKRLKVLITVKTYPIPSKAYDELVCTAGVTEEGEFVRLYPINYRELPHGQKYEKYQWIEVEAEKHARDPRKESWRPEVKTMTLGAVIPTKRGDWSDRAQYVMVHKARSMEELAELQEKDRTSLGILKPKVIEDLKISPDAPEWPPKFLEAMKQMRIFDDRKKTKEPPRKVPFKFHYVFKCDDSRCKGHRQMIEDWEVGALYWNLIDGGVQPEQAALKVKEKFLNQLCGPGKDTHFFVGTIAQHPKSWVVIGVFWPKNQPKSLFDDLPRKPGS